MSDFSRLTLFTAKRILSIAALLISSLSFSQKNYFQQELKYTIAASLDDVDHSLSCSMSLEYRNKSADTLYYIWFHLWPNAFKTDQTAFSEERLQLGKTDFYFSNSAERGYINQLDFKSAERSLEVEDHPLYIDVVKLILDKPLAPGDAVTIKTPFRVKIPAEFGAMAHFGKDGQSYQLADWYPQPAVYDREGWHIMPYRERGGRYTEFADFDVRISLPANYVVAATGILQNEVEKDWLAARTSLPQRKMLKKPRNKNSFRNPKPAPAPILSDKSRKTLRYTQTGINGFAFVADKYFRVFRDSLSLSASRSIEVYQYTRDEKVKPEKIRQDFEDVKKSLSYYSKMIGDYPFGVLMVVDGTEAATHRKVFPMMSIHKRTNENKASQYDWMPAIWFSAGIGFNTMESPWLQGGLIRFYSEQYASSNSLLTDMHKRSGLREFVEPGESYQLESLELQRGVVPIGSSADSIPAGQFNLITEYKSSKWLEQLRDKIGQDSFNQAIQSMFIQWKGKHLSEEDFKNAFSAPADPRLVDHWQRVDHSAADNSKDEYGKKSLKPYLFYRSPIAPQVRPVFIGPALGYNVYDGLMVGALAHNYGSVSRMKYFVAPLFATKSKELNGAADLGYSLFLRSKVKQIRLGLGFARFSTLSGKDSNNVSVHAGFIKFSPSVKITFNNPVLRSTRVSTLEWKTFLIGESVFQYYQKSTDQQFYPERSALRYRYLNQLSFSVGDDRILYPYSASLAVQQARDFYRVNLNTGYLFNYADGGGLRLRLFAVKFGYLGKRSPGSDFALTRYQPKLTAVRGSEDYTYSNYFPGRNESTGLASQQIMLRDGDLKIRTDIFQDLQGRSDNWVSSLNLSTSLPSGILPKAVPLRIFLDIGTYAEAWDRNANQTRFLYTGGLELSLLKDLIRIYAPLMYSKSFRDALRSVPEENKFFRKISFSIDLKRLSMVGGTRL